MNTNDIKSNKPFTLRISYALLEAIKQSAKANKRSTAKEIEYILEQSIKAVKQ